MTKLYCKECRRFLSDDEAMGKEAYKGSSQEPYEYEYICDCGYVAEEVECYQCQWCSKYELEEFIKQYQGMDICLECQGEI